MSRQYSRMVRSDENLPIFATFKIDWAIDGAIPWRAEPATRAGTVHLAESMDFATQYAKIAP